MASPKEDTAWAQEGGLSLGQEARTPGMALPVRDPSHTSSGSSWEDDQRRILPHLLSSASSLPGPAPTLLLAQVTSAKGGENNECF